MNDYGKTYTKFYNISGVLNTKLKNIFPGSGELGSGEESLPSPQMPVYIYIYIYIYGRA